MNDSLSVCVQAFHKDATGEEPSESESGSSDESEEEERKVNRQFSLKF